MHADEALTRRGFLAASAAAATSLAIRRGSAASLAGAGTLKVGLIGAGGRGTGAAYNALGASPDNVLWAMGDAFPDRLDGSLASITKDLPPAQVQVPKERQFLGFDAYKGVIASGVDVVLLATPPHFRPIHLAAAVAAGKHVFMEKPVAVDPAGVRSVLASGQAAASRGLSIVAGTQRRHETCYLQAMERIHAGDLGKVLAARCSWNQGGLWVNDRRPQWSDMEWQLRNWLYFTWLSGDHICEQHVHNLDVINWALRAHPLKATGMGGRQVRTQPKYGHIFDHFAVEYEYPDGVCVHSMCRQIDGCAARVDEVVVGSEGTCATSIGRARIDGAKPWKFTDKDNEPYGQEHADLFASIRSGTPLNEARNVAEATLTAIMGRMSAYTGKPVTWDFAMNSTLDLTPPAYEFGALAVPEVPVPGVTPLV